MERAILASALLLSAASAAALSPPSVPPRLQPGPAETLAFGLTATGVHVYECRPNARGGYKWTFVRPDVTLSDDSGSVATQQEPNLWQDSRDRSTVSAVVRASAPAGGDNLPWTLMAAASHSGTGTFSGVTSVQRVNTVGGVAPGSGCDELSVGTSTNVAFSADYYFYRARG